MAKEREPPTIVDYVVTALSPVLVMALVGSLAFFLLDVLYAGQYAGRLWWTLFWFVFGSVLIARVAIQVDPGRAQFYGLALGGVVFLATLRFVDYSESPSLKTFGWLINLGLIAVVWWSAKKLTWDCTFVDENVEDAGRGLVSELTEGANDPGSPKRRPMGVWVVYFSLAALPLFGLGQALIPVAATGRRQYAFWLMIVYVGSGLGLLLTTNLLGLRRYLRQRRLQMPPAMTGLWLGAGAVLIAAFLLVGALLPRPHAEYALVNITPLGSPDRDASRLAPKGGNAGKGEGRPGADGKVDSARDGDGGKGKPGGKASGNSGKPEGSEGGQGKTGGQSKGQGDAAGKTNDRSGQGKPGDSTTPTDTPDVSPPGVLSAIANVLKWIVFVLLLIATIVVAGWFVLRHLASASEWARRLLEALSAWWQSLFGGSAPVQEDVVESVMVQERPRPFADFRNPFTDGRAAGQSPEELVTYGFAALEAWATERDLPRRIDETPLEFAARLGELVPDLDADGRRLTNLYARLAYARRRLPDTCRPQVEQFWQRLEGVQMPSVSCEPNA